MLLALALMPEDLLEVLALGAHKIRNLSWVQLGNGQHRQRVVPTKPRDVVAPSHAVEQAQFLLGVLPSPRVLLDTTA